MRNNNISDPFDSLTSADVQRTDHPIDVYEELMRMGFYLKDGKWFTSRESRHTCHFCRRIITNPVASIGEVSRLELYQNRDEPRRGFAVAYQISSDTHAGLRVCNKFISNDLQYNDRHSDRMREEVNATREGIQRVFLSDNLSIS